MLAVTVVPSLGKATNEIGHFTITNDQQGRTSIKEDT